MMQSTGTSNVEYGDDDGNFNDGVMRTTSSSTVSPMETTSGGGTAATEFSQDETGARVMRGNGNLQDSSRTAFLRFRRWRKLLLAATVLLATVVVVAFAMGRKSVIDSDEYQDGLEASAQEANHAWHLVSGAALTQPDLTNAMETHEYVNFGYKMKMTMNGDRVAIAQQGSNKAIGGAIQVFSHWEVQHGASPILRPNQWFHEKTLKIPPADAGDAEHEHQAVDMSEDGHRIAFNQGNTVHVYFLEGTWDFEWDPLGKAIELPPHHDPSTTVFGHEVAMSGDGYYVAILGYSTSQSERAFVDIFHYKYELSGGNFDDEWIFVKEITLQSDKGGSMAMDTFGKRLVIGETASRGEPARISVHDRMSDDDITVWKEHKDAMTSGLAQYGSVVSLSNDGNRLAFGSENGQGNFFAVLQAEPDDDETDNVKWVPLGKVHETAEAYKKFGASLKLSFDGAHLVVGAPGTPDLDVKENPALEQYTHGEVYLYKYDEEIGQWTEAVPPKRSEEAGDAMGTSVSIDQSGTYVAAGSPLRYPFRGTASGAVSVYYLKP